LTEFHVLVGHALNNDLIALKMIHLRVVDTSVVYLEKNGRKCKLKALTKRYLHRDIQTGEHDSVEDCVAPLHLVYYKINHPDLVPPTPKNFFDVLRGYAKRSIFIDRQPKQVPTEVIAVSNDDECMEKLKQVDLTQTDFVLAQLHGIDDFLESEAHLKFSRMTKSEFHHNFAGASKLMGVVDSKMCELYAILPPGTLLLITTAYGDTHTLEKLHNSVLWTSKDQKALRQHVERAQKALSVFCVKE